MGLLSKLKSLLGAGDGDRSAGSGVDVTVERDPSADGEQAGGETTTADEPTDTDAAASTVEEQPADPTQADEEPRIEEVEPEQEVEPEKEPETEQEPEPETESEPETEPEPETESGPEPEPDADIEATDTEPEVETEADEPEVETEADEPEARTGDGEPVLELKGIGPAYAERLEAAGVTTVADLAAADPDDLAERVDLSAKRVGRWIDRAKDRS